MMDQLNMANHDNMLLEKVVKKKANKIRQVPLRLRQPQKILVRKPQTGHIQVTQQKSEGARNTHAAVQAIKAISGQESGGNMEDEDDQLDTDSLLNLLSDTERKINLSKYIWLLYQRGNFAKKSDIEKNAHAKVTSDDGTNPGPFRMVLCSVNHGSHAFYHHLIVCKNT